MGPNEREEDFIGFQNWSVDRPISNSVGAGLIELFRSISIWKLNNKLDKLQHFWEVFADAKEFEYTFLITHDSADWSIILQSANFSANWSMNQALDGNSNPVEILTWRAKIAKSEHYILLANIRIAG